MSGSSTLDPDNLPVLPNKSQGQGHDIGTLGPSDTSDSGSDVKGANHSDKTRLRRLQEGVAGDDLSDLPLEEGSTSDSHGTGDRASVNPNDSDQAGADIEGDHIETIKPER